MNRIILGTMTWGSWGKQKSAAQMAKSIETAVAEGFTTFDHADIYGGYTTEKTFGEAFEKTQIPRTQVQWITKCGIQYPCDARDLPVKHYDYSPEHIHFSVDRSLNLLRSDYLDLLLLHRPSPLLDAEAVGKKLQELLKSGKIKAVGVSNFTPQQIQLLQKYMDIEWNQIECSLTHDAPLLDGSLDFHQHQNIGTMAWSPLGSYFREDSEQSQRLKALFKDLCRSYQCTEDQLLLAWLCKHPAQIYPVIGSTQVQRWNQAQEATQIELSLTDWFLMWEASMGHKVP